MKETKVENNATRPEALKYIVEFNSMGEFINYIKTTPTNKAFQLKEKLSMLHSKYESYERTMWCGTESFDQAVKYCVEGQQDLIDKLSDELKSIKLKTDEQQTYKNCLDVCGYQAIVPLYLNGIPNNMVNKRLVPIKNKIITINKSISISAKITQQQVIEESTKCLKIINKLESEGYKVNLNLLMTGGLVIVKIQLKAANEKLNIGKLAFPLVAPSMLRRLFFRFIETYPHYTKLYVRSYGWAQDEEYFKQACGPKEKLLNVSMSKTMSRTFTIDEMVEKIKNN